MKVLLELQDKDRGIESIHDELRAFEPELAELDGIIADCESGLAAARRGIEEAGERRTALDAKIENLRQMQERRRQRLEWVQGAKEASTLMAELDLGRGVLAKEEADWMRSADEVQEAELGAAEAENALAEARESQATRREEIAAARTEVRERLGIAEQGRGEVEKRVSKRFLKLYQRIRRGRAPQALYPLHGDACGHCFTTVPMHRRQEILQGDENMVTCEACGVLMYDPTQVSDE